MDALLLLLMKDRSQITREKNWDIPSVELIMSKGIFYTRIIIMRYHRHFVKAISVLVFSFRDAFPDNNGRCNGALFISQHLSGAGTFNYGDYEQQTPKKSGKASICEWQQTESIHRITNIIESISASELCSKKIWDRLEEIFLKDRPCRPRGRDFNFKFNDTFFHNK